MFDLTIDPDELDDLRAEFAPRRRRSLACSDRMCGADDCPNCHPETEKKRKHEQNRTTHPNPNH